MDRNDPPEEATSGEALSGAARYSRYDGRFRPNADGAVRSVEEALAIAARNGIHIDREEYEVVEDPIPRSDCYASYFDISDVRAGSTVPWSKITAVDGRIVIHIQRLTLGSDEMILAALAHEYHESQALKEEFGRNGWRLRAEHLRRLVESSDISFHNAAWDFADELLDCLRTEGRSP